MEVKEATLSLRQKLFLFVGGIVLLLCLLLVLIAGPKNLVTSAKSLFDRRPNLTEVTMFETITNTEITRIEITVQSAEYPEYTETATISDASEIEGFLDAISRAKLIETDTPEQYDPAQANYDTYVFYLEDTASPITVYTKPMDASFILVEGEWQEIDTKTQPTFYEQLYASSEEITIYDQYGLAFYPQEWLPSETELTAESYGIDVSYYQGVIDWEEVAQDGVDFAIIRIGVRYAESGILEEDPLARYNLQEATKYGIAVGAYFFSTATTEEEVLEEAELTFSILSGYAITYPVVYDCEMFHNADNRNYALTVTERSYLAEVFLSAIEAQGYTGMFYASKSDLEQNAAWETNYLQSKYRIWVAQYPGDENEATPQGTSSYSGRHEMWQYTAQGQVAGISGGVDRNVAYFSYSTLATPLGTPAEEVSPDYDALAKMEEVYQQVTAKEYVNVRSAMDSTDDSNIIGTLYNGEIVYCIGIGSNGWSKIEWNGGEGYVKTSLLTTDITYVDESTADDDGFETEFQTVNETVTAKEMTNLRSMPSVTDENSVVVAVLVNGDTAVRTGVSGEGFSRVEYQGQVLYCVSSYLEVVE